MTGKRGGMSLILTVLAVLALFIVGCQCGTTAATTTSATTTATTSTSTQTTTPGSPALTMTLYENTEHGFSFEHPEGWDENTHGGPTSCYFICNEPEGSLSVFVSVDYQTGEIVLEDAVAEIKEYMETMPEYEMFSEGYVTIGDDISGYEMLGQGDEDVGELQKYRYIVLVREGQLIMVGVYGEPDRFDAQRPLLDDIIDSFELLPYTYEPPASSPGGTYTNAEFGFSITYPEGWSDCTTGGFAEILDLRADTGVPEVMVRTMTGAGSVEAAVAGARQVYTDNFPDYELLSEGEITMDDGTPAYEFVFNATMEGFYLTAKCVIVMRGEDGFNLMGFGPVSTFAHDEAIIDAVIRSFHLE